LGYFAYDKYVTNGDDSDNTSLIAEDVPSVDEVEEVKDTSDLDELDKMLDDVNLDDTEDIDLIEKEASNL